ncbi:MAG: TPM domain-containing protein [Deltaproteobacteria bacterium]|nr:TPM domain-containing protein [Deltaproteobacteria bacterium]
MVRWTRRTNAAGAMDAERIEAAIREVETTTSGEIRVCVAPYFWGSVERNAKRAFGRLGMRRTRARNGVLFFIVPSRHKLVVLGDEGIHARVGVEFWKRIVETVLAKLRDGDPTGGLIDGIREVGERLRAFFPREADDRDELPDEVHFEE